MAGIEAAHHPDEAAIGAFELHETVVAPPQAVALRRQRPVGIDAGMDEQQRAVIGVGGAAQRAQQAVMAGHRLHVGAQLAGPAGQRQRAGAGGDEALLDAAAIGRQRGAHAMLHHPAEHLAGIGRELQLQQLLPHLLLAPRRKAMSNSEHAGPRQHAAAERQQLVDGAAHVRRRGPGSCRDRPAGRPAANRRSISPCRAGSAARPRHGWTPPPTPATLAQHGELVHEREHQRRVTSARQSVEERSTRRR